MTEEKINEIALSRYPIAEFWVGSGNYSRLYDQNARDRAAFIEGIKEGLNYKHNGDNIYKKAARMSNNRTTL